MIKWGLRPEAPDTTGTALQPLMEHRRPNQNQIISFFTLSFYLLVLRETILECGGNLWVLGSLSSSSNSSSSVL